MEELLNVLQTRLRDLLTKGEAEKVVGILLLSQISSELKRLSIIARPYDFFDLVECEPGGTKSYQVPPDVRVDTITVYPADHSFTLTIVTRDGQILNYDFDANVFDTIRNIDVLRLEIISRGSGQTKIRVRLYGWRNAR